MAGVRVASGCQRRLPSLWLLSDFARNLRGGFALPVAVLAVGSDYNNSAARASTLLPVRSPPLYADSCRALALLPPARAGVRGTSAAENAVPPVPSRPPHSKISRMIIPCSS